MVIALFEVYWRLHPKKTVVMKYIVPGNELYECTCCICRSSHSVLSTSVNPSLPRCAFCSNRCTNHRSRPSAAVLHTAIRACTSAVCEKQVRELDIGEYCIRSKHVANCDRERLTEVIVAFCVEGSTKEISRTKASSEPPKSLTIHVGAFCLQPKTRSVLMIPVFGSTERSTTSILTT